MKKTKARKPDAAERAGNRIGEWWIGKGCVQHSDRLKEYATATIRRAINAATVAERKRITGYIHNRAVRMNPKSNAYATLGDVLSDIENGANPLPRAAKKGKR